MFKLFVNKKVGLKFLFFIRVPFVMHLCVLCLLLKLLKQSKHLTK